VAGEANENWRAIDMSLRQGHRGLSADDSLARLLARERGVPNKQDLPPISVGQILSWADQYHAQSGKWPTDASEPVAGMKCESWPPIDAALRAGNRRLPGGDSLPRLLARERG
jgi:hypothetical protein